MSNLFFDEGDPATGQKVLIATTVYDVPAAGYVFSIQKTREYLHKAGIQTAYLLLQGNCHVDDARNSVVQQFLLSDCTDLVFIDADVAWQPDALLKLVQADAYLVGGVYPYRREGQGEKLPVLLIPDVDVEGDLLQVAGLPSGFMRIKRHVIESMSEKADKYWNKTDKRLPVPILFERTYERIEGEEVGARWGGDLSFCRKWHNMGGKMYAMPELRLSHSGGKTLTDSLAASIRRVDKRTLAWMAQNIRKYDLSDPEQYDRFLTSLIESREYIGNQWAALEDVLSMSSILAKEAQGPIIESGSGLTTIIMAASTDEPVYCLEHDPYWAKRVQELATEAGVKVNVRLCDIEDRFYKVPENLPLFALGLNDGPPRYLGTRTKFFDHFGYVEKIIVDDADDTGYGDWLKNWAGQNNRNIDFIERSALIR